MDIIKKNYKILQKIDDNTYACLMPETEASNVDISAEGIDADNVKDAMVEVLGAIPTKVSELENDSNFGTVGSIADVLSKITTHTGKTDNPHGVTKNQVGLGNVTNDVQVKRTEMGKANGVATLGSDGKVPSTQLPSYVDDVVEGYLYNNSFYKESTHKTAITGETGKIYVDATTNITYRWSGSAYVEISASLALGETSSTAYAGNKGKANADAISALQTRASTIEGDITNIKSGAETAQTVVENLSTTVGSLNTSLSNVVNGTTKVPKATAADSADKLKSARTISLNGDASGSTTFDGSSNKTITVTLGASGVTAGTYSAVSVDAKGRVTWGGNIFEIGSTPADEPTSALVVGGLFFAKV